MATLTRDDISLSASPYVCHAPAFGQNKSEQIFLFSWVWQPACESPPALGWADVSPFSVFFTFPFPFFSNTLKHDLLWILTCDKLYTLLIACQLEGWSRTYQWGTAALVGGSRVYDGPVCGLQCTFTERLYTFSIFWVIFFPFLPLSLTLFPVFYLTSPCSTLSSPSLRYTTLPYSTLLYFYPIAFPTSTLPFSHPPHSATHRFSIFCSSHFSIYLLFCPLFR